MPRRRELADVADGISGHFVGGSDPQRALDRVAIVVRDGRTDVVVINLLAATVTPPSRLLTPAARAIRHDLLRHLAARGIRTEWVTAASIRVEVESVDRGALAPARCQVAITDDRGQMHTSTRRTSLGIPRLGIPTRLGLWLRGFLTSGSV